MTSSRISRRRVKWALSVVGLCLVSSCSGTTTDTRSAEEVLTSGKTYYCGNLCTAAVRCGFTEADPACVSGCEAYVEEGLAEAPECADETLAWLRCYPSSGCTFSPQCIESEDVMEECRRGALGSIFVSDGGLLIADGG